MRWSVTVVLLPSALLLRLLLLLLVSPTHTFEPKWWRLYWYNPEKHAVHHFEPFLSDGMYRRFVQDPAYLPVVAGALREAFQLCRFHMQGQHYWNCPIVGKGSGEPLFGKMTAQSNRESAFLFALTTAAVVRAVARACSAGQLSDCSCDPEKRGPVHSLSGHTWRPCDIEGGSDNLNFANKFSKRLIDRFESCNRFFHQLRMVRLHNIAVGRTRVKTKMECQCSTPFGSCFAKKCDNKVISLEKIAANLFQSFVRSERQNSTNEQKIQNNQRCRRNSLDRSVRRSELPPLWYLDETPSHCQLPEEHRWKGERCMGPTHCSQVCCRGFTTRTDYRLQTCAPCRIRRCCHIACSRCLNATLQYYCI